MQKYWLRLKTGFPSLFREEKGQGVIILAFSFVGLLVMLGLGFDVGMVYIERFQLGRALDAASMAAVSELPYEEEALTRARGYMRQNGYNDTVSKDIRWLIRGCNATDDSSVGLSPGNVGETGFTVPYTRTTEVVGALYTEATDSPDWLSGNTPRATFVVDTGPYQAEGNACDPTDPDNPIYGTANKVRVAGEVHVRTWFMYLIGIRSVTINDESIAEKITDVDVVVALEVSGQMEYQTTCYDCWVRNSYDILNYPYPQNGYFNPLPPVPLSPLCTEAPAPYVDNNGTPSNTGDDTSYLVHEAELYSTNQPIGGWQLERRTPGQGFWVIQRGSRREDNIFTSGFNDINEPDNFQGNQAGTEANQSSNPCDVSSISWDPVDCDSGDEDESAYIKAHPFPTYSLDRNANGNLLGATYNDDCFTASGCWSGTAPTNVPWVEYDFTPSWSGGTTYIWIRAIGGGARAYEWDDLHPSSLTPWRDALYWQVEGMAGMSENTDVNPFTGTQAWRDNRADHTAWQWIRLGAVTTSAGTEYTLKIYQGSAGYKIDKIIFTDDNRTSPSSIPALNLDGGKGPEATYGSATREACNLVNPAYGLDVGPNEYGCPATTAEALAYANAYSNGSLPATTSGTGCTAVLDTTNQLGNSLYRGVEPLRTAQEAIKNFAMGLDPTKDQFGFVAFADDVINETVDNPLDSSEPYHTRAKLQCIKDATINEGDVKKCTDLGPLNAYLPALQAVEVQWPRGNETTGSMSQSNVAAGIREGLEELGVAASTTDHDCSETLDDGSACDRRGTARRMIVLVVAGPPTAAPAAGDACHSDDLWNGAVGNGDAAYECAMYYAAVAAAEDIVIHVIGLGPGVNSELMTAIATGTDPTTGEVYFTGRGGQYFEATTPGALDAAFRAILGNEYVRLVG